MTKSGQATPIARAICAGERANLRRGLAREILGFDARERERAAYELFVVAALMLRG